MVEEFEQERKQKKNKDSSADKIDSFFDSHNLDTASSDQFNDKDFEHTEKMIDQLLEKDSSSIKQSGSLKPKVEVYDKEEHSIKEDSDTADNYHGKESFDNQENEQPVHTKECDDKFTEKNDPTFSEEKSEFKEFSEYNGEDQQQKEPILPSQDKEEIFEIDRPHQSEIPQKTKVQKHHFFEKKEKTKTIFGSTPKNKQKKEKKSTEKNAFSFHLPKLNLNLSLNKDKTKNESHFFKPKSNEQNKKKEELKNSKNPVDASSDSSSGRIHGLNQINEVQEETKKNEKTPSLKSEEKKKSLFNSPQSSFNLFKKKESKSSKTKKKQGQSEDQQTKENVENELIEKPQKMADHNRSSGGIDEDVIQLLKITDDLLGKLPDEIIEEFSQSEDFTLYEKVMQKYDILE